MHSNTTQWRIQDFPQGGAPTPKSAIIFQFVAENCMKMKEFGPPGGGARPWRPPLDPPMQPYNHTHHVIKNNILALVKLAPVTCSCSLRPKNRLAHQPLWELATPPQENPSIATNYYF